MIKKISLFASAAALLIAISAPAPAQANDVTASDFYVGGYGGHEWTNTSVTGGSSFDLRGNDGGVFAGYNVGSLLNREMNMGLEGGLEAHYGWTWHSEESGAIAGGPASLEKKNEWGLDFRPGLSFITNSMPLNLRPYAILGYRQAQFRNSITGNTDHGGFDLGAGMELVSYQHFGVRLDYNHVYYRSHEGIDPHENDLRLGLAYHF